MTVISITLPQSAAQFEDLMSAKGSCNCFEAFRDASGLISEFELAATQPEMSRPCN